MKLSILVPGIRTGNWEKLYRSIENSIKTYDWEVVFIGPYDLPESLKNINNIKYIKDFGTPIRCQQMGLLHCDGEWINWAADDGFFLENSNEIALNNLSKFDFDYRKVIVGKYHEGDGDCSTMSDNNYYLLNYHMSTNVSTIPKNYFTINVGLISKKILYEIGGWDTIYEVCPMSYADLAVRLQKYGCDFIMQDELMFKCGHMPGTSGDHGPIHWAQILHDEPLFKEIWLKHFNSRLVIDINNWKNAEAKWSRRFN